MPSLSTIVQPGGKGGNRPSGRPGSQDPGRRRQIFGPILPMEQPGFFARLFTRR